MASSTMSVPAPATKCLSVALAGKLKHSQGQHLGLSGRWRRRQCKSALHWKSAIMYIENHARLMDSDALLKSRHGIGF
ncbi:hypothetical protein GCM10010971_28690 [Silvimonas amylolytica]|uniref:Uncharacterized protein n=1 Tax=Silvimonas amylolytica TaxID=449663 RepID=A0ABQ2PN66_9NEIS|nr:hypothetical protein GCM10010971_28690 [Silvimonas amylolytica]